MNPSKSVIKTSAVLRLIPACFKQALPQFKSLKTIAKQRALLFCYLIYCSFFGLEAQTPYIASSSGTNNLCAGASITLTGNNIYNYKQWQVKTGSVWVDISGATAATYGVTSAGEYRLNTSAFVGFSPQTYTNAITISNASALSITDNLPTLKQLTTSNAYSALINTTNPPDYTSYNWYINGVPVLSPLNTSVQIRKPGDYMLVTTGPCGPERSNVQGVFYETADPNWTVINTPVTCNTSGCNISTNTILNADITIQSGGVYTIVGSKVNFNGCYGIKVESGGELIVQDRSILSSTSRWKGILVENGGKVTINGGSHISDAIAGVIVQGEVDAYIAYNSFGRNILHIGIDEYTGGETAYVAFDTFGHVIDSATALTCGSYSAYNNMNVPRGIYLSASGGSSAGTHPIQIHENHVWMSEERSNRWHSGFALFTDVDSLEILTNEIYGFFNYAIKCSGGENMRCQLNNIKNLTQSRTSYGYATPAGMPLFGKALYFKNVSTNLISDNDVRYWIYGVQYYENLSSKHGYFYENTIRSCKYGLVVAHIQDPINYTGNNNTTVNSNQIDLHIQCNLFTGNEIGIVGTGKLTDQGSSTMSAGNRFYNPSLGGYLNSINSIIWHYNSNAFQYNYHFNTSPNLHDKPDQVNNGSILLDNVSKNGSTSNFSVFNSGVLENSCTVLQNGPASGSNKIDFSTSIILYPNPTNINLTIEGLLSGAQIKLLNINGQILNTYEVDDTKKTIDISNFPIGVYIIYIVNLYGKSTHKFVKVQ